MLRPSFASKIDQGEQMIEILSTRIYRHSRRTRLLFLSCAVLIPLGIAPAAAAQPSAPPSTTTSSTAAAPQTQDVPETSSLTSALPTPSTEPSSAEAPAPQPGDATFDPSPSLADPPVPAPPAVDQPVAPNNDELSSKTAEPDLDWAPTDDPSATVVPGRMRSDREEIPAPFTKEEADEAETMEAKGRMSRAAQTSQWYWPSPHQVCGAIRDKYNSLGGPASFLSFPNSGNIVNPGGTGERVQFLNGPIYWSAAIGAHPVVNSFLNRWGTHG